jgi:RimJ/RimL family protein N-acetyltransferase
MNSEVSLRAMIPADLPLFFAQQLDPEANYRAAFTVADPTDRAAFTAHWERITANERVQVRTILLGEQVAGYLASFERFDQPEVCYWLGQGYWGRGVATTALTRYLQELSIRPLYARAAIDNAASLRVLANCGFVVIGHDRAFAHARGQEVEEVILQLAANGEPRESISTTSQLL